jgi:hypothetical protein
MVHKICIFVIIFGALNKKIRIMTDNLKDTGHPDKDLINMNETWEVLYWSKKWGITAEQLKQAGKKASSSVVRKIHDAAVSLGFMKSKI